MGFTDVPARYDGTQLESEILELWREHDVFNAAQEQSAGRPLYVWNGGAGLAPGATALYTEADSAA